MIAWLEISGKYSKPWVYFLNIKIKIHCLIAEKFSTYSPQSNVSDFI